MLPFWNLIAEGAEDTGNIISGWIARKAFEKQKDYGSQMIREAKKLSEAYQRPDFEIPGSVQQQMRGLQGRQFQQMPGLQMALGQMGRAYSQGIGAAERSGRGGEAVGAAGEMYARQIEGLAGLAGQQAQYQDIAQRDYLQGLGNYGQWEARKWQWDKADPYLAAQQKAAQLEMMGRGAEYTGIGQMGAALGAAWQGGLSAGGNVIAGLGQAGVFQGGGNQPGSTAPGAIQADPQVLRNTQMPAQGPQQDQMDFSLLFK